MSFSPDLNTIYLDMDGVLADFDAFVTKHMGRTFPHSIGPVGDREMWNFLSTFPNLYLHLPPTEKCFELWDLANSLCERVEILTAIPRRDTIPTAREDKILWGQRNFGEHVIVNFGPYSKDKWKHAKCGDVLVDDRRGNIEQWVSLGKGVGILHDISNYQQTKNALIDLKWQKPQHWKL